MCGIAGVWNTSGVVFNGQDTIARMNQALRHRGPDDEGTWSSAEERLYLGHRRLSILDTSAAGHQPMVSPSGTVIVFNGEIFNYLELKKQFFASEKLRSNSDTEILLLLYEKFGHGCLRHLTGMFAFAIWDPKRQELFMARDRAGKKPFYYTFHNGVFAFASELKALLELPGFERTVDPSALYHFLTFNLLSPPQTMFSGISKLPPAHYFVLRKNGTKEVVRYWTPDYTDSSAMSEHELAEKTEALLSRSVKQRMISDVPVGAFLSGGVDSSAIVSMMADVASAQVRTYSIGFEGQSDYDERAFAAAVARQFNTVHHEHLVTRNEIGEMLPSIVEAFDEPLADATCIPIWFLSRQARNDGTPVILTGDGSDELFAGYRNWQRYIKLDNWYTAYSAMPGFLKNMLAAGYRSLGHNEIVVEMLERASRHQVFFWGGAKSFKESVKREVLSPEFLAAVGNLDSYAVIDAFSKQFKHDFRLKRKHPVDWMCYLGFHFNVPNYYLHRMDRLGMAHGVEIRTPFLDHAFAEFALSIEPKWKIQGGEPKYILKKALDKRLGRDILYRKKRGFNVPLKEWAGELMLDHISRNLRSFCEQYPAFDYEGLNLQVARLRSGDAGVANRLWTIYFLMHWFDRWMGDGKSNSKR